MALTPVKKWSKLSAGKTLKILNNSFPIHASFILAYLIFLAIEK
jgi:hypothetical protein